MEEPSSEPSSEASSEPLLERPDEIADEPRRSDAITCSINGDRVVVSRRGRVFRRLLTDPSDPVFADLPRADLDDGRPLRRTAFDVWAGSVRAAVASGREFETTYRAPRPLATGLAIGGAAFLVALCSALLLTWALRPDPAVDVRPTLPESFGLLLSVAAVVGIIVLASAAMVRAWRCRRGSYVELGPRGVRTRKGGRAEPLSAIAAADWHGLVRCTRIRFTDGRPDLWVPAETGALRRLDLLLAGADERLGAALRERL